MRECHRDVGRISCQQDESTSAWNNVPVWKHQQHGCKAKNQREGDLSLRCLDRWIAAEMPAMPKPKHYSPHFTTLLPSESPSPISGLPARAATVETVSSGQEVRKLRAKSPPAV